MKIFIIIGDSLNDNSSTNIFKRRIINNLSIENKVTVLMDNNSHEINKCIKYTLGNVLFIEYSKSFFFDLCKDLIKKMFSLNSPNNYSTDILDKKSKSFVNSSISKTIKTYISLLYKKYRFNSLWVSRASKFATNEYFDHVISISHPPASHKVALNLIETNRIQYNKWTQIWFEPWYEHPTKCIKTKRIIEEERRLLHTPDKILYSNPYFLSNQKKIFTKYRDKMSYIDLPVESGRLNSPIRNKIGNYSFGYFGNYNSKVRNILPFYESTDKFTDNFFLIIGNSDLELREKRNLKVFKRLEFERVKFYEEDTDVLVVLGNFGDQIPGKLYEYSNSNKYILVILEGEEKKTIDLYSHFYSMKRYVFCKNNSDDIVRTIGDILAGKYSDIINKPVSEFSVTNVTRNILKY